MWLLVVLGFIWIGEHKGKIILDCIALLEEGEGKHENIGTGEEGQGRKRGWSLAKASSAWDQPSFGPIHHPSPHLPCT